MRLDRGQGEATSRSGAAGPAPGRIPILVYHSVSDDPPDWISPLTVTPRTFSTHLDLIAESGREAVTVTTLVRSLQDRNPIDRPLVLITFDDGFADFARSALPALERHGLASTLYVTTGALAGRNESVLPPADMLESSVLPELEAAGVEIGSHTHTHRQLDLLPADEVERELRLSGHLLADELGHEVPSFAYPYGFWRPRILGRLRKTGFSSACAVGNWVCRLPSDTLTLPRLMVKSTTTLPTLERWLSAEDPPVTERSYRPSAFLYRQYRRRFRPDVGIGPEAPWERFGGGSVVERVR